MDPIYLTVMEICGDYAVLRSDAGEERQTDFINVVAWRQTAEFVTRFFRKGSMIAVQGSIQTRNYEDKNGNKRTAFEIVADNVSFCGDKGESKPAQEEKDPLLIDADEDDDLPF